MDDFHSPDKKVPSSAWRDRAIEWAEEVIEHGPAGVIHPDTSEAVAQTLLALVAERKWRRMTPKQLEALRMLNDAFESHDGRPVDQAIIAKADYHLLYEALAEGTAADRIAQDLLASASSTQSPRALIVAARNVVYADRQQALTSDLISALSREADKAAEIVRTEQATPSATRHTLDAETVEQLECAKTVLRCAARNPKELSEDPDSVDYCIREGIIAIDRLLGRAQEPEIGDTKP